MGLGDRPGVGGADGLSPSNSYTHHQFKHGSEGSLRKSEGAVLLQL